MPKPINGMQTVELTRASFACLSKSQTKCDREDCPASPTVLQSHKIFVRKRCLRRVGRGRGLRKNSLKAADEIEYLNQASVIKVSLLPPAFKTLLRRQ
jgi:hypothetical protein